MFLSITHSLAHTCLEDLVAYGESGSVRLIVRDELDEELLAAGDDGRGCNLATELAQHGRLFILTVVNLHIVVPEGDTQGD